MSYTMRITEVATGIARERAYSGVYRSYYWIHGNMACDCNRRIDFLRAGGDTSSRPLEDARCSTGEYTAEFVCGEKEEP